MEIYYKSKGKVKNFLKTTPLQSSSFKEILPPFPVEKNPDNLIITFDVNFKTQALTKFRKSKRFEETVNKSKSLHEVFKKCCGL